jgi:hypothetical protein
MPTFSRVAPSVDDSDHQPAITFYLDVIGFTLKNKATVIDRC